MIGLIGFHALTKILRVAGSSLSGPTIISLDELGGPRVTCPRLLMISAMLRAACSTVKNVDVLQDSLVRLALEGLPLSRAIKGDLIPDGWDSPAFCTVMSEALKGLGIGASPPVISKIREIVGNFRNGTAKKGLQARFYKALRESAALKWDPGREPSRCYKIRPP